MAETVVDRIARHADGDGARLALHAPDRRPLTYAGLRSHLLRVVAGLNDRGIGRNDRLAIVLPNGPEMATACLAAMAGATAAPLNPDFKESEYEVVLALLRPRALLADGRRTHPAKSVARAIGIPVIEIEVPAGCEAGLFDLAPTDIGSRAASPGLAGSDDVALLLQTSGTTASPKTVPLTQRNLCASIDNLCRSLQLSPGDRCLHLLPYFHIGGIVDVLAAPLAAGGSVVCASGFSGSAFFRCVAEFAPTWSQAVPAMLQEILDSTADHAGIVGRHSLRLMRSVSAPLPPALMQAFEQTFDTPVIEIYGMSETAGVICSNPLPPAVRKPGSVGIPAGPELLVVDRLGEAVPTGQTGEVLVRGANVMAGYDGAPADNEQAFFGRWLRTGDEGHLDDDGYLVLTGRLKELINRGGEKISPNEIDRAVLAHPGIADAATFAVTHDSLGEDVAVAVVLKPGTTLAAGELVRFLEERLAYFKVPRLVYFVEQVPRTPGGKLQRNRLRERFGAPAMRRQAGRAPFAPPQTPVAKMLAELWSNVLRVDGVGTDDDFFDLGGDSLKAAHIVNELQRQWGEAVYVSALYDAPTVGRFERYLDQHYPELTARILGHALRPRIATSGHRVTAPMLDEFRQSIVRTVGIAATGSTQKNPPAVFILSPPRSGSTLLRAMLAGHPDLFAPPELYLLSFDNLADRRAWFSGAQRFQLEGNTRAVMQLRNCDAQSAERLIEEAEQKRTSTQEYFRMLQDWAGGRLLVDKTPYYAARVETLERAERYFDSPLYIHLLRHPYGMIRSFEEAKLDQLWYPRLVGEEAAKRAPLSCDRRAYAEMVWLTLHENILRFLDGIPRQRQCRLRFEDLVRDPRHAMEALCAFLDLPFAPEMLEPQKDRRGRMTDGIHPVSRMIGDTKFHQHDGISRAVADLWQQCYEADFLSDRTFELASRLGYHETVADSASRMEFEIAADS